MYILQICKASVEHCMFDKVNLILGILFSCECYLVLWRCLYSGCGHRISLCKFGGADFEIHQKSSQERGRLGCVGFETIFCNLHSCNFMEIDCIILKS